jgi:hypothetical protein
VLAKNTSHLVGGYKLVSSLDREGWEIKEDGDVVGGAGAG